VSVKTEVRNVIAVTRFRGTPGREQEAAEAWAFELTYYFLRGIGEPPQVTYQDGIYTCRGIMQTTHPGDRDVTVFDEGTEPWDLDFGVNQDRRARLRELYLRSDHFFDGRDHGR
jgi:hypothetical protein